MANDPRVIFHALFESVAILLQGANCHLAGCDQVRKLNIYELVAPKRLVEAAVDQAQVESPPPAELPIKGRSL
jgi:hypothetical protein